jgi:C-terminal processing protease CtpA/Prc
VVTIGAEPVRGAADAERRVEGAAGDDVVLEVERDGMRRTVRYAREAR